MPERTFRVTAEQAGDFQSVIANALKMGNKLGLDGFAFKRLDGPYTNTDDDVLVFIVHYEKDETG